MDDADAPRAVLVIVVAGHATTVGAVTGAGPGGLPLVDALLRLRLVLGRHGVALRLRDVRPDLRELLELAGAADLLGLAPPPDGAAAGQASMRSGRPKRGNSSG